MKKIKNFLKGMKPFRKSRPAYSEEDAIYSISGVDNADLDLNRLGEVIEMDESEIRSQYQKWTNEIAQRNLNFLKEKTAHEAKPSLIAKHSAPQLANHGS